MTCEAMNLEKTEGIKSRTTKTGKEETAAKTTTHA
jgi:hypothetical protein